MVCIFLLSIILFHGTKCIYISPTKKNDALYKHSVLAYLVFLLNTKAESFCGKNTSLSAKEGSHVIFHPVVAETEEASSILWIGEDGIRIATIHLLDNNTDIQYNINDGKVNISPNGSLTVNDFNVEDVGTYIVVIQRLNQLDCKHTYYLSMSEKSPCGDIRDVSGKEEEEITLPLDADGVQLKIVYWFLPREEFLAKTKPGGYIHPQRKHDRRLKALTDGSLTLTKLTMKDQGIYRANVHMYSGKSCSQEYNVSISGVISERANMKTVHVQSYEEQEVTLPLPEHLMYQVEDVFWMKDYGKHIATAFPNGSLHVLDFRYQGRLNSTSNSALIIFDLRVEDRGKYSADIHLINKELYTEIYHLSIYKKSYYISLETRNIKVKEGGNLILKNDVKEIKSIDWLTPRWIRFAVTKQGGDICIFDHKYSDRLSSLSDGSITIKSVTKKDQGIYSAHVFSHTGMMLEQQYSVSIDEDQTKIYVLASVVGLLILILALILMCLSKGKIKKKMYEIKKLKKGVYEVNKPTQNVCEEKNLTQNVNNILMEELEKEAYEKRKTAECI